MSDFTLLPTALDSMAFDEYEAWTSLLADSPEIDLIDYGHQPGDCRLTPEDRLLARDF